MLWIIAYVREKPPLAGWYVINMNTGERISGPYTRHADAVEAAETMAWRTAQGWAP